MKPGLTSFQFTAEESQAIAMAMKEQRPWDSELIADLKTRMKNFLLDFGEKLCCYCYRDFQGEFIFVIDIEHILPKRHFKPVTFDMRNLAVACKRCNMKMKRDNLDFIDKPMDIAEIENSAKYKFIHPNIDDRDQHLTRLAIQSNAKRIVKYVVTPGSDKGEFTCSYFQLQELEIDSYDAMQGANIYTANERAMIESIRAQVRELEQSPP